MERELWVQGPWAISGHLESPITILYSGETQPITGCKVLQAQSNMQILTIYRDGQICQIQGQCLTFQNPQGHVRLIEPVGNQGVYSNDFFSFSLGQSYKGVFDPAQVLVVGIALDFLTHD